MTSWPFSDDRLRAMYAGHKADRTARRLARMWTATFALGLAPRRWVTLEVTGRRTGKTTRFPLGMADWDGRWYLVSMLGEQCNWVKNVRAAGGRVSLSNGRSVGCQLVDVAPGERAPIIKRYLNQVPGARPHFRIDRRAPIADFEAIAAQYPVFLVTSGDLSGPSLRPAKPCRTATNCPQKGANQ